jgi:hypothetical protein
MADFNRVFALFGFELGKAESRKVEYATLVYCYDSHKNSRPLHLDLIARNLKVRRKQGQSDRTERAS